MAPPSLLLLHLPVLLRLAGPKTQLSSAVQDLAQHDPLLSTSLREVTVLLLPGEHSPQQI